MFLIAFSHSCRCLVLGVQENWGCISFRPTYLLIDEANTSLLSKQNVAQVICHELSHMWLGNLVTPEWWSWLGNSESWAMCAEYLATEHIFPEWNVFANFNRSVLPEGFNRAGALACCPCVHALALHDMHCVTLTLPACSRLLVLERCSHIESPLRTCLLLLCAALANTHPIQQDVCDPAEIDEIFDAITYDAGKSTAPHASRGC